MRICSLMIAFVLSLHVCLPHADARTWTDQTGKFKIEADFVELDGDQIKLRKQDGSVIKVPLARLSDADQEFAKRAVAADPVVVTEKQREQVEDLIRQARELIALDPVNNARLAGDKLREASAISPHSIKADYLLGLLNTLAAHNSQRAFKNFSACLDRDPTNISVLNNLAVTEVKLKKYSSALEHWKLAMKLSPGSPEITQNLGRLLRINDRQIRLNERLVKDISDLYASAVSKGGFPRADPAVGWLYMPLFDDTDAAALKKEQESEKKKIEASVVDDAGDSMPIVGGGTGIAVGKDLILTNRHVVNGADGLLIKHSTFKNAKKAQVLAKSKELDLALVRCKDLGLVSVPLTPDPPRRGTDIIVLGHPEFMHLGVNLKTTRGTITSTPSRATDGMLLIDAEINPGNSGGPIANQSARVVAIATAGYTFGRSAGKYGAGIPTSSAVAFLTQHAPDVKFPAGPSTIKLDWPDVDAAISRSTVLVLMQKKAVATGLSTAKATGKGKGVYYHDRTCPACDFRGVIRKAKKKVVCPHCRGTGVDPNLK